QEPGKNRRVKVACCRALRSAGVLLLQILLDLALGAALGFLGGLFGIGGGIIAIPVLSLVFGMDQHLAQGTTLVMVVPNVMLGLWRYYKRGGVNIRYAIVLGSSAVAV